MNDNDIDNDLNNLSIELTRNRDTSPKRTNKNSSPVWKYASKVFKLVNGINCTFYKCNFDSCQYEAKFGGTANIANHLRSHGLILETTSDESQINSNNEQLNVSKISLFNSLLLSFIITSFLPFEIVENFHLKRMFHLLNPKYKLPCSKTVANSLLDNRYNEVVNKIKKELEKVDCICATTYNWTSVQDYGYIRVTIHYVDDDFKLQSNKISTENIHGRN